MQNPTHYKKNSMRDTRIPYWLVIKRYWVNLLAISITWFIYDFITCVLVYNICLQWLILLFQVSCKILDDGISVRSR
jgi:hypothetical protein